MAEGAVSLAVEDSKIATTARAHCYICQRVVSALQPHSGHNVRREFDVYGVECVNLSSWEELQSNRNCSTCLRITDLFKTRLGHGGHRPHTGIYQLSRYDLDNGSFKLTLSSLAGDLRWQIELELNPLDARSSCRAGVIMDPCWLDLERVSQWIRTCDTTHTNCYSTATVPTAKVSFRDTFFISVSQRCLVKAHHGEKYIALSYVWGPQHAQFETTRANFPFLTSEGSLSSPRILERLPGTIQRAMQFASLLEVDLLWVDRLCIMQDGPVHTASQINNMASVYSHAYFTLCAADGSDAESGLQGIPHSSTPRDLQQDIFAFHSDQSTLKMVRPIYKERAIYDERAWTFQETVLSPRILAFRDNGLHWKCQGMFRAEQYRANCPSSDIEPMIRQFGSQWPSVDQWAQLVFRYQVRRITYEHDALRAFSGIIEAMSEYMPGGFHFGLPELFFDMALLWVPKEHLTRRAGAAIGDSGCVFPSWSWAGWRGELGGGFFDFESHYLRCELDKGPFITCVKWFKIRMDTPELVKIYNDYDRCKNGDLRGDVELQPGWSSHLDKYGIRYYKYDMAEGQSFRFPLPTIRHPQPADAHTYQSVLFCRAWRVYLELGSALSRMEQGHSADGRSPVHWVTTEDGSWAGVLYVHRVEDSARLNRQCELVVISSHYIGRNEDVLANWSPISAPKLSHGQRPRSERHFYNCLWIEWQNGIAYRKGLARVAESVYNNLPKEEIDLYLG